MFVLSIVFVLLFILLVIYFPPRCLIRQLSKWYNDQVIFCFDIKENVIALSIDDSPTSDNTTKILDCLKTNNIQCTFFVIGSYATRYPEVMKRIVSDGHEIGNHGYFDRRAFKLSNFALAQDVVNTEMEIMNHCEEKPIEWFRPGSGFFHLAMIHLLKRLKYRIVLASIYPHDCLFRIPIINYYYIMFKIRRGDIIVIHDRPWTIPLLKRLLPKLKQRGFKITTIGKLAKLSNQ